MITLFNAKGVNQSAKVSDTREKNRKENFNQTVGSFHKDTFELGSKSSIGKGKNIVFEGKVTRNLGDLDKKVDENNQIKLKDKYIKIINNALNDNNPSTDNFKKVKGLIEKMAKSLSPEDKVTLDQKVIMPLLKDLNPDKVAKGIDIVRTIIENKENQDNKPYMVLSAVNAISGVAQSNEYVRDQLKINLSIPNAASHILQFNKDSNPQLAQAALTSLKKLRDDIYKDSPDFKQAYTEIMSRLSIDLKRDPADAQGAEVTVKPGDPQVLAQLLGEALDQGPSKLISPDQKVIMPLLKDLNPDKVAKGIDIVRTIIENKENQDNKPYMVLSAVNAISGVAQSNEYVRDQLKINLSIPNAASHILQFNKDSNPQLAQAALTSLKKLRDDIYKDSPDFKQAYTEIMSRLSIDLKRDPADAQGAEVTVKPGDPQVLAQLLGEALDQGPSKLISPDKIGIAEAEENFIKSKEIRKAEIVEQLANRSLSVEERDKLEGELVGINQYLKGLKKIEDQAKEEREYLEQLRTAQQEEGRRREGLDLSDPQEGRPPLLTRRSAGHFIEGGRPPLPTRRSAGHFIEEGRPPLPTRRSTDHPPSFKGKG